MFNIDLQGDGGINGSQASLLLHLQHHSGPVHHAALADGLSVPDTSRYQLGPMPKGFLKFMSNMSPVFPPEAALLCHDVDPSNRGHLRSAGPLRSAC